MDKVKSYREQGEHDAFNGNPPDENIITLAKKISDEYTKGYNQGLEDLRDKFKDEGDPIITENLPEE